MRAFFLLLSVAPRRYEVGPQGSIAKRSGASVSAAGDNDPQGERLQAVSNPLGDATTKKKARF